MVSVIVIHVLIISFINVLALETGEMTSYTATVRTQI